MRVLIWRRPALWGVYDDSGAGLYIGVYNLHVQCTINTQL